MVSKIRRGRIESGALFKREHVATVSNKNLLNYHVIRNSIKPANLLI